MKMGETNLDEAHLLHITLPDNESALHLCGWEDEHLKRLEALFEIEIYARGNVLALEGDEEAVQGAAAVIEFLLERLDRTRGITPVEVQVAAKAQHALSTRALEGGKLNAQLRTQKTMRGAGGKPLEPRSLTQVTYLEAMRRHSLVFGLGPAGTGKTYLAVARAVEQLLSGAVQRIILSRPAVEAGERLGFLPGDLKEKVDPYMRPIYDALHDMLPAETIRKYIEAGTIEIAPLAYMRGRTLSRAFVLLDEAQNATPLQMKMFLTRLGEDAQMVITGDPSQVDLPSGVASGLLDATQRLKHVPGIEIVTFASADVLRHPLVQRIVTAYEGDV